jgi:hypothetical protein
MCKVVRPYDNGIIGRKRDIRRRDHVR